MCMTDSLSDLLTRIRNGGKARFEKVDIPFSNMKANVARVLKEEGFIKNYKIVKDKGHTILRIYLKYDESNKSIFNSLKRISKASRRVYVRQEDIPKVMRGMGIAILSTSKGVMTGEEARKNAVGGELLCQVW
ncbi:MAG: 30S ribosomal protein S8 [Thermodesulfobacteriota bacterium]|nr:30S ribosomal protein S8 [Desulfovibrionales bacterium]MDQ7838857.1 30S ribosomal protein S8 [Thermodesulfobacteriota bacterium]